jgi:hypothetical protein
MVVHFNRDSHKRSNKAMSGFEILSQEKQEEVVAAIVANEAAVNHLNERCHTVAFRHTDGNVYFATVSPDASEDSIRAGEDVHVVQIVNRMLISTVEGIVDCGLTMSAPLLVEAMTGLITISDSFRKALMSNLARGIAEAQVFISGGTGQRGGFPSGLAGLLGRRPQGIASGLPGTLAEILNNLSGEGDGMILIEIGSPADFPGNILGMSDDDLSLPPWLRRRNGENTGNYGGGSSGGDEE